MLKQHQVSVWDDKRLEIGRSNYVHVYLNFKVKINNFKSDENSKFYVTYI